MTLYTSEKKPELNDRLKLISGIIWWTQCWVFFSLFQKTGRFFFFYTIWLLCFPKVMLFLFIKKESRIHHNICVNTLSMETSYSRFHTQKYPFWQKKLIHCNRLIVHVSHLAHMELQFCQFNIIPSCNNFNDNLLTCKRFQGTGTSATLFQK